MKRLFLVIILFTLPMLACAITPEIEAILALVEFEIVTTIQEDGSGTVELGVGSNEKKDDGEFLVECTDDQLEDLPPGAIRRDRDGDQDRLLHVLSPPENRGRRESDRERRRIDDRAPGEHLR